MSKRSLASKVLAYLKGGDEAKLVRFESKLEKFFKKQIEMRKENITNLEEKIADAKEHLNEMILSVDLGKVNSTDSAEGYVPDYVETLQAQQEVITDLEFEITTLKEEITSLENLKNTIDAVTAAEESK